MQINIAKKTGALLTIIVVLLAIIFVLIFNKNNDDGSFGMHGNTTTGMNRNSTATSLTGADVMFLQMMIPHHQQAVDISTLALKTSKDAELLALAKSVRDSQSSEISLMKTWLKEAGAGTDMGHTMDEMGGMLDDAELSALSAATGKAFDLLWLKGMIGHHDGAIHMTTMIRDARAPHIKSFGEKIVKDQSAQIIQMNSMLKRIG